MGQKTDPRGFRLVVNKDWSSRWYANTSNFATILQEDIAMREFLRKKFGRRAAVGRILIERPAKSVKVTMFTARPGVIIGKKGEGIEQIKAELQKMVSVPVHVNVEEIRKPELNAQIVADQVAMQIEKRVAFRRAMKRAMQTTIKVGAVGVKIMTSGRLNGVDIARSEWYREGRVPLHTLRANIDYATSEALTTYGIIGIKVWIYKGDVNLTRNKFVKEHPGSEEEGNFKGKRPAKKTADRSDRADRGERADTAKKSTAKKRKVGTDDVAAK